jgi:transposase-like protein
MTPDQVRAVLRLEDSIEEVARDLRIVPNTLRRFVNGETERIRDSGQWRRVREWAASRQGAAQGPAPVALAEAPAVSYGDPMSIPALQWREAALGVQQRLQSIRRELDQVERLAALLVRSLPVEATISHPTVPPHLAGNPLVQAALSDAPVPPQAARRRRPA